MSLSASKVLDLLCETPVRAVLNPAKSHAKKALKKAAVTPPFDLGDRRRSGEHGHRVFEVLDDLIQQLRAERAVDDPVIN